MKGGRKQAYRLARCAVSTSSGQHASGYCRAAPHQHKADHGLLPSQRLSVESERICGGAHLSMPDTKRLHKCPAEPLHKASHPTGTACTASRQAWARRRALRPLGSPARPRPGAAAPRGPALCCRSLPALAAAAARFAQRDSWPVCQPRACLRSTCTASRHVLVRRSSARLAQYRLQFVCAYSCTKTALSCSGLRVHLEFNRCWALVRAPSSRCVVGLPQVYRLGLLC